MCKPSEAVHLENHGVLARSFLFKESETHRPVSMFCVWPGMSTQATATMIPRHELHGVRTAFIMGFPATCIVISMDSSQVLLCYSVGYEEVLGYPTGIVEASIQIMDQTVQGGVRWTTSYKDGQNRSLEV